MTHHTPEPFGNADDESAQSQYNRPPYDQAYYDQSHHSQPQYAQPQYAQPQYAQPPPAPTGPRPGAEKNWLNVTALVLSLAGLLTGVTALGGVIVGHMGLRAAKRGEADNRGLGLAGVILGYIILVVFTVLVVGFVWLFAWLAVECGGNDPASWCTSSNTTTQNGTWGD